MKALDRTQAGYFECALRLLEQPTSTTDERKALERLSAHYFWKAIEMGTTTGSHDGAGRAHQGTAEGHRSR